MRPAARSIGAAWLLSATALGAAAQDSSIVFDGTLGDPGPPPTAALAGGGLDYRLEAERGRVLDATHLFHSFSSFDLATGDAATFLGPASVEAIFARVTGGESSQIGGLLRSEIAGADLFFLNPAGVVFGPGAQLDLGGSLFVASADAVEFGGGLRFSADPGLDASAASILQVPPPADFGFSDRPGLVFGAAAPGAIAVDRALLSVDAGERLVLAGGDIAVTGDAAVFGSARLDAPGGEIELSSRGGEVHIADGGVVAVSGGAGDGRVSVEGERIEIVNGAQIVSEAQGTAPGGRVDLVAAESVRIAGILLVGSEQNRAGVFSDVARTSTADGGAITVSAPSVVLADGARLRTDTRGAGDAGSVTVDAQRFSIEGGARIDASTRGTGDGGTVVVRAGESISIVTARSQAGGGGGGGGGGSGGEGDASGIITDAREGSRGDGGDISIATPLLVLNDGRVSSFTRGAGNGGDITIDANVIDLQRSQVGSNVRQDGALAPSGRGGSVTVRASEVRLGEGSQISARSLTQTLDTSADPDAGRAGSVAVEAGDSLRLSSGSLLTVESDRANAGDIVVRAGELVDLVDSRMVANVAGGAGGSISIAAPTAVALRGASAITANASQLGGSGGAVTIRADSVFLSPQSVISASAPGGPEFQGRVEILSPEVDIESQARPLDVAFLDAAALIRPACAARAQGAPVGSFTVAQTSGLATSPEDLLLAFDTDAFGAGAGVAAPPSEPEPPVAPALAEPVVVAQRAQVRGAEAFRGGRFEEAERELSGAAALLAERGTPAERIDALRALSQSQHAQGRYAESESVLVAAIALLPDLPEPDPAREAALRGALGDAYLALGRVDAARAELDRGGELARRSGDAALAARLLNNLGNLHAVTRDAQAALQAYEQSAELSAAAGRPSQEALALSNAGRAALDAEQIERAGAILTRADERVRGLPPDYARASLLVHLGRSYERLAERGAGPANLRAAYAVLSDAEALARELGARRLRSYALGNLASLYAREGRLSEAVVLTRRALREAERSGAAEAATRWSWQLGRLLWRMGKANAALDAHRRAVAMLEATRQDARARYGAAEAGFRRAVAPVYRDYVDALLQSAGRVADPAASETLLLRARSAMELLRAAELRDYFRDACVAELESRAVDLDAVSRRTRAALVYPIALPDRLELLVSLPSGIERHTLPIPEQELDDTVAAYEAGLTQRVGQLYLAPAQRLYDWLVRPYAERLAGEGVRTLVFVPDGALRRVPMAALHDGAAFLTAHYAVAIAPGLSLVDPEPLESANARVLLAGLSHSAQGFPELPGAARELEAIESLYGGEVLLDESFRASRFERTLAAQEPAVVHVASHAVFTGDPATSFVLTHDGRLTFDRMAEVVGPARYRAQPIELLALSACQTAAGDDRAALGLAGVAVRAGARSALGSLWRIQDEATTELVVAFYQALREPGVSKAEALRRAQLRVQRDARFEHPYYWSAFLLISNWL